MKVADLNKQISESKIKEIIEANELVFNEEIASETFKVIFSFFIFRGFFVVFVVIVHRYRNGIGLVPEYVHYGNIIDTFNEGKDWLDTMRIPYLADLNKQISESKIKEIIEANELAKVPWF